MQIHRIFDILTNECVCWCWFFIMVGNLFLRTAIVVVIWGGIMILICSEMTHFTEDCTKTNRNEHWTSPPDVAGVCSWSSFSFGEKEQKKSISQVINNDQFIHNDCTYVDKTNDLDCICSVSSETLTKVHLPSGGGERKGILVWLQIDLTPTYCSLCGVCLCVWNRKCFRKSQNQYGKLLLKSLNIIQICSYTIHATS